MHQDFSLPKSERKKKENVSMFLLNAAGYELVVFMVAMVRLLAMEWFHAFALPHPVELWNLSRSKLRITSAKPELIFDVVGRPVSLA